MVQLPLKRSAPSSAEISAANVPMSSIHLDALRGAAALVVFLGHTRDLYFQSLFHPKTQALSDSGTQALPSSPIPAADSRITFGNEAVMIFFVLSGYLVGSGFLRALRRRTWTWRDYLIKRMTRLWVVLIPALLFGVSLDYIGVHFLDSPGSIYTAPAQQAVVHDVAHLLTARVIVGNLVFLQGIRVPSAGSNDSLWSLANEFWYYLAFPLLVLALVREQTFWRRGLNLLLFLGIALLAGKGVGALFPVWVLGALISLVPLRIPKKTARVLLCTTAVLFPAVLVEARSLSLPLYAAQWLIAFCSAVLIYLIRHQTQKGQRGLYPASAQFLSRISYTLYLVHLPLAVFICACINRPWHRWNRSPQHVALYAAINAGILLFCWLFYLAFEAHTDRVRQLFEVREHAAESGIPARAA